MYTDYREFDEWLIRDMYDGPGRVAPAGAKNGYGVVLPHVLPSPVGHHEELYPGGAPDGE